MHPRHNTACTHKNKLQPWFCISIAEPWSLWCITFRNLCTVLVILNLASLSVLHYNIVGIVYDAG